MLSKRVTSNILFKRYKYKVVDQCVHKESVVENQE